MCCLVAARGGMVTDRYLTAAVSISVSALHQAVRALRVAGHPVIRWPGGYQLWDVETWPQAGAAR